MDLAANLSKAADALSKVNQYYAVSQTALDAFNNDMSALVQDFVASATKFTTEGLKGASDYADAADKVAGSTSSMAGALDKLRDYGQVSRVAIDQFVSDSVALVSDFYAASKNFSIEMMQGAIYFSETASKVADAVTKMAGALDKVRDWAGVARVSIAGFSFNARDLVADFADAATNFTNRMLDGAKDFSETTAKVADGVSKMAGALDKVRDWSGVARVSIAGFTFNARDLVADFVSAGSNFSQDMLASANGFADTSSKVADAASKMAGALDKIRDWSGISRKAIYDFSVRTPAI
jgi:hypothetical protein